jgi:hypothetical protein
MSAVSAVLLSVGNLTAAKCRGFGVCLRLTQYSEGPANNPHPHLQRQIHRGAFFGTSGA